MRVSFKPVCFLVIFILAFLILLEYSESQLIPCDTICPDECGSDYCLYGPDASGNEFWESDCLTECPYDDEIGCDIGCGAECEVDNNCLDECASAFDRHTTCRNTNCNDCDCTGSEDCRTLCTSSTNRRAGCTSGSGCTGSEDCRDLCEDGTHMYTGCTSGSGCTGSVDCLTECTDMQMSDYCARQDDCTSGSGCTGSVDCGSYTCVVGTGCTTTCSQECGAECEGDSDCSSDGCSGSCPGCT
ncbi:MAG: hypothetical protein JSV39_02005 [Candidatus Aenigmatarchaeota archaeon]|nr:MAG: hypothetical protein JSV39_02005 [Candidatus Aenigmarchaeota archaeon]